MYVFDLRYPGSRIVDSDNERAWEIQRLVSLLEGQLTDAAVALNLFVGEANRPPAALTAQQSEGEQEQVEALVAEYAREVPQEELGRLYPLLYEAAVREVERKAWREGRLPGSYQERIIYLHAHSYLYALDSFEKLLQVLIEYFRGAEKHHREFKAVFPDLTWVRNSAHHVENRSRGLDNKGKWMVLKPMKGPLVHAGGGVLILSCLLGNRLQYTMQDGALGEVEVSERQLSEVVRIFQELLDGLPWAGRPRLRP